MPRFCLYLKVASSAPRRGSTYDCISAVNSGHVINSVFQYPPSFFRSLSLSRVTMILILTVLPAQTNILLFHCNFFFSYAIWKDSLSSRIKLLSKMTVTDSSEFSTGYKKIHLFWSMIGLKGGNGLQNSRIKELLSPCGRMLQLQRATEQKTT